MRKSNVINEEEWIANPLKKSENSSTEEGTIYCSNSNEDLTRLHSY